MSKNICRPVVLFNNFVPPFYGKQEWEYEALGYYDGISVGENIIKDAFELRSMWDNLADYAKRLEGKYTAQVMYIFRSETNKTIMTDEKFWDNRGENDEYPFLFLALLRLNKSVEDLEEIRKILEGEKQEEGVRLITYLSLDNNDLIAVIRSREYCQGIGVINQFHQKRKSNADGRRSVFYDSFSVGGINKKCLNSKQYIFADQDKKIDKVCLRIIEKEPGAIQYLKEELGRYFDMPVFSYPVLGCEDEVVIIENITCGAFWKLYRDETGLLSSSNGDVYHKAVMGVTSLVLQKMESCETDFFADVQEEEKAAFKKMCGELRSKCISLYENSTKEYESKERMYYKAILQIINSLQKYENMEYLDYTYIALYKPMQMLIALMEEANEKGNKDVFDNISNFFNAVNLLTQNSIRLERQFIQSVELNARIYEAPVQISILYTAYFMLLRDILNEGARSAKQKYEFMICPGMVKFLNVQRLLAGASKRNRLLLVEIPENQMYDVRNLLIIIAHEAAHFVGRDIRQREIRYEHFLKAIVKSVSTFLVLDQEMHEYCSKTSVEQFENEYLEALKGQAEVYCDKKKELSNGEYETQDRYHVEYMEKDLWLCAQTTLIGNSDLLDAIGSSAFYDFCGKDYQKQVSPENRVKSNYEFKEDFERSRWLFLNKMLIPASNLTDERCINNIIDDNVHLFKESFADLISILLLELTEEEYFDAICSALREYISFTESRSYTGGMWRIAIVIKVMCQKSAGDDFQWRRATFEKMRDMETDGENKALLSKVLELLDQYLSGQKTIFQIYEEDEELRNSAGKWDCMRNFELGKEFCAYLGVCFDRFQENVRKGIYNDEKLDELRTIYRQLNKAEDVEQYIYKVRAVIEQYKRNFYE